MKYHEATPTFHQWRDQKQVYGLNFATVDDAAAFAQMLRRILDLVNGAQNGAGVAGLNSAPNHHNNNNTIAYNQTNGGLDLAKIVEGNHYSLCNLCSVANFARFDL